MAVISRYVKAESLEQAQHLLLADERNAVLGGYTFLRLGSRSIETAIDLSGLDLEYIRETAEHIEIGAMTSLREIEESSLLRRYFSGILPRSASGIAGVQVRNQAVLGGTVAGRYGFSDVLCALVAMDAEVVLYNVGKIPLEEYLRRKAGKEIVKKIIFPVGEAVGAFQAVRNSAGDFALLNVAVSHSARGWRIVVGARPAVARSARAAADYLNGCTVVGPDEITQAAALSIADLSFGATMKAKASYRKAICPVLVKREIEEVISCK